MRVIILEEQLRALYPLVQGVGVDLVLECAVLVIQPPCELPRHHELPLLSDQWASRGRQRLHGLWKLMWG